VWQRADILFRTQRACMRKQEWLGRTGEAADSGRHHGRGLLMARDDEPYPPALAQAVHKVQVLLACRSARRAQQRRLLCCSQAAHSQPGAGRAPAVSRTGRNDEQQPRQAPPLRATGSGGGAAHQEHQRCSPRSRSPAPCAPSAGVRSSSAEARRASSRAWSRSTVAGCGVAWQVRTHRINRSLAFIGPPSSAMGAHCRLQPLQRPAT